MNILQKAKLSNAAFKIGGAIISCIGVVLMTHGRKMDGYIDGTHDVVMSYKVDELNGGRHKDCYAPLQEYFEDTIEI